MDRTKWKREIKTIPATLGDEKSQRRIKTLYYVICRVCVLKWTAIFVCVCMHACVYVCVCVRECVCM